jgi:hypothetical protein
MEHPSTVNEARAIELTGVGLRLNEALQKFSGQVPRLSEEPVRPALLRAAIGHQPDLIATLAGAAISLVIAVSPVSHSRAVSPSRSSTSTARCRAWPRATC